MKVLVDDYRVNSGYDVIIRTFESAKKLLPLIYHDIELLGMDYSLNDWEPTNTGADLIEYLRLTGKLPKRIEIVSGHIDGAEKMEGLLIEWGYDFKDNDDPDTSLWEKGEE